MTYTFKLSRRLAVARTVPLLGLVIATACDTGDPLGFGAETRSGQLALNPVKATAEPHQKIKLAFRDQIGGGLTPSYDVRWTVVGGAGVIAPDGSFTATQPGVYQIVGTKGNGNGNNGQGKGNGGPNQTDTSTVVVVPQAGSITTVGVSPASASVDAGGHLHFEAVGLDVDSTEVAIGVEWTATGGTIDGGGHYIAGTSGGNFQVVARHPGTGLADTANVSVVVPTRVPEAGPAPSGDFPNQPSGYVPIAAHRWPNFPNSSNAALGQWGDISSSNYSIVDEPTPTGDGRAMQVRLPEGMSAGVSPGKFRFWDIVNTQSATRLKEMYISTWVRIPGVDYENQLVATKLFYFAYGNSNLLNDGGLTLNNGTGAQAIQTSMSLRAFISPSADQESGSVNYHQNTSSSKRFTVGPWHRIEMLVKAGTPDRFDGLVRVWLDGELVMDHSGVKFLDSDYAFTQGFFNAEWAPVWGGVGGVRTRDDYIQVDDFYVSGLPE